MKICGKSLGTCLFALMTIGLVMSPNVTFPQSSVPLIYDDFNDGVINGFWAFGGIDVSESNGLMRLEVNATDHGGWIRSIELSPAEYIDIEFRHYMHPGGENYYPTINLQSTDARGDIYIEYQRSAYSGNHCYDPNKYNKIVIKDAGPFGSNCAAVSAVQASDYYDTWIITRISYDSRTGLITVDAGNDGTPEVSYVVPIENRFPIKSFLITSSGWDTGHYHLIDWLNANRSPSNSGNLAPVAGMWVITNLYRVVVRST